MSYLEVFLILSDAALLDEIKKVRYRSTSRKVNIRIYKTIIKPVVYGSEIWTYIKEHLQFHPHWKGKYKGEFIKGFGELEQILYKEADIVCDIRLASLECLGYENRKNRIPKILLHGKPYDKR